MAATAANRESLRRALQDLYDVLDKAYWAASTVEGKDMIYGVADGVSDVLTDLSRLDLASRTADYAKLKAVVEKVNEKLDTLKGDIDRIVHAMKIAGEVVVAIDKAIAAAAKFFL